MKNMNKSMTRNTLKFENNLTLSTISCNGSNSWGFENSFGSIELNLFGKA